MPTKIDVIKLLPGNAEGAAEFYTLESPDMAYMRPLLPFQETYNQSHAEHHLSSSHRGPLNYCGHCVSTFYSDTCCMHLMHSRLFSDRLVLSPLDFFKVYGAQHLTRMEFCHDQYEFVLERS